MTITAGFPTSPYLAQTDVCTLPIGSICRKHSLRPGNVGRGGFHQLIKTINNILGPSSGIDSSEVDVNDLMEAMRSYTSSERDWDQYAHADFTRNYTRNFVDHGNGKSNVLILVWSPGKGSLIHDHAGAHCIMKVPHPQLKWHYMPDWTK
jgi:hypothetical protein